MIINYCSIKHLHCVKFITEIQTTYVKSEIWFCSNLICYDLLCRNNSLCLFRKQSQLITCSRKPHCVNKSRRLSLTHCRYLMSLFPHYVCRVHV